MAGRVALRLRALGLCASLLGALAGSPIFAATLVEPQDPPAERDEAGLWFFYQDQVEVTRLLDFCSSALGLAIEYDDSVTGSVTVRSGKGIPREALWPMVNRLLATRGLASVQSPGERTVGIVALDQAARLARIEQGPLDEVSAGFVKVLRPMHRATPDSVIKALQTVLSVEGSLIEAVGTGQLLLAGLKPQIREALSILDALDSPTDPTVVESMAVRHLPPAALVTLLDRIRVAETALGPSPLQGTLLADPDSSSVILVAPEGAVPSWRERIRAFDVAESTYRLGYVPNRFELEETARLVGEVVPEAALIQDELTGTLLVTATRRGHDAVEALFERLEGSPTDARRTLRSFPVGHRDVKGVFELLEGMVEEGVVLGDIATLGEGQEALGSSEDAPTQTSNGPLTVAMDEPSNRIVAIGSPRLLDELGRLIESLDVSSPQVLVEVLVVTLTDDETQDLAVELQKIDESGGTLWRLASFFGGSSPDRFAGTIPPPGEGLSGLEGVVLDPGSYSGVLRALETLNDGRTLTVPKVLVGNNQPANLTSVLQSPYLTTNASNTVATTAFGGTLDAGTTVTLTPQITDGDRLLLEYAVSLSRFTGDSADPTLPPPRQENTLASVASLPDGHAVVVGGLEIEADTRASSQVPWLGSIPLVGWLFKSESQSLTRSHFFVFMRCSVLRHERFEDLKYLSVEDLETAQVETGWPEVRPRIMR